MVLLPGIPQVDLGPPPILGDRIKEVVISNKRTKHLALVLLTVCLPGLRRIEAVPCIVQYALDGVRTHTLTVEACNKCHDMHLSSS